MARQPNQGRADLKLAREELEPWSTGATFLASRRARRLGCEVKVDLKAVEFPWLFQSFFPASRGTSKVQHVEILPSLGRRLEIYGKSLWLTWHFKHIEDRTNMEVHGRGQMGT